ncbi:MAG: hypothetical protein EA415_13020 [Sphaerobacteraceae bacterium]|nr:MAG: hypothetical protein EA415_13020 [Sphaerobacteraceae bacterium]
MAFNPVKRVRERRYPSAMQAELAEKLTMLAALPPVSETPYLTVSLDWRPSGSDPEYRAAMQVFEREAHRLQQEHWPRGDIFDSLGSDIEKIRTWLTSEVDPATRGILIVANSGADVFETVSLGLPLENRVVGGAVPALLPLARLDEDNPTYAVLLADQQNAYLSLISQAHRVEELAMASSDYPRKQHSGGWSQRRFQQRADERIMALGRQISSEVQQYIEDRGIEMLILAGDEVITSTFDRTMPEALKERVIDRIRLDIQATTSEVIEATLPIAERAEADRELESARMVVEAIKRGGAGAGGSDDVFAALAEGKVNTLVMNEDFHEDGWADFVNHRYGAGEHGDVFDGHVGEFSAAPIIAEDEMVRLAIQNGAEIDIIHTGVKIEREPNDQLPDAGQIPRAEAAQLLDKYGGVAALLHY